MIDYISVFIFFFAVIDPVGTVPVFIAATSQFDEKAKRKIALQAACAAALILLFFIVAGELILTAIDIPLPAFEIAGGIILFLFALTMIFGDSKPDTEMQLLKDGSETAIFPLAVPSLASPGAMLAAVLLTENSSFSIFQQVQTAGVMLSVLFIALLFMLAASWIHRFIGNSGASIISKVMGMILAAVATNSVLSGIKVYFLL
ncbi:MAG: MarC family protein [Moritella sp.]|uniref:MarC family protein n=1 Tax=unclassified Moritella TaxID=2637987 RepID=UPI00015682E2|nr:MULTISPECIES: MarC family protein [unclassified Moritella]EDM67501.1 multiple antibiotic resistance protein MarC [Moritella sp. PE36]MBL1415479.1 MarC family protein [Moritella sp.]